jgi:hypothetical protein
MFWAQDGRSTSERRDHHARSPFWSPHAAGHQAYQIDVIALSPPQTCMPTVVRTSLRWGQNRWWYQGHKWGHSVACKTDVRVLSPVYKSCVVLLR